MSRILVVDDDPDLRALVGTYLKAAGHAVDFAEDGVAGAAAAARQPPDLIVTDFQMPRMDGFGLFNAVRADPRSARVPVIMVTAHGSREMLNKALELGIDDFVTKPFERGDLLQIVADRLKPQQAAPKTAAQAVARAGVASAPRDFLGTVLCCQLCSLERFALALKKEELDELLGKFAVDASGPVQREGGWLTHPDFYHLYASFEEGAGAVPHALRALRCALAVVLAAQRLKPWIAARFPGRDLPEFVVAVGVHTGTVTVPAGAPALQGQAAEIAAFLAESSLNLRWSVAASRAAAKSAGFAFLAGRGAQLRMPKSEGTVKVVEVKGLERPTVAAAPKPAVAAALIEAAVQRNDKLVTIAAARPRPAPAPAPAPDTQAAPAAPAARPEPRAAPQPAARAMPTVAAPAAAPAVAPAVAPAARKPEGPVIGYDFVRKLADNGAVATYLVMPEAGGAQQVLKTVLINDDPKKRTKWPHLQKFVEHYAGLASLEHPNLGRALGQGLTATHLYVVQEYCPGGDLRNLIAERMIADDAVKTLLRIAAGLRVAHQRGFIHGDLKPANVMIRADGSFAIVDFALARIVEYAIGEGETGVLVRSPEYLSPEMINGQPADAQADIYTLGLLLHEMLTGRRAYDNPDLSRMMMDHLAAPVPTLPAGYEKFQPLLDRLMAKNRAERFGTVQDVIAFMAQTRPQG